jgi:hypothetical protein
VAENVAPSEAIDCLVLSIFEHSVGWSKQERRNKSHGAGGLPGGAMGSMREVAFWFPRVFQIEPRFSRLRLL